MCGIGTRAALENASRNCSALIYIQLEYIRIQRIIIRTQLENIRIQRILIRIQRILIRVQLESREQRVTALLRGRHSLCMSRSFVSEGRGGLAENVGR